MPLYKAQTRYLFHCHIKIKIPAVYGDDSFDRLFGVLEGVDRRLNSYTPGSSFDRINKAAGTWMETDDETIALLRRVKDCAAWFDGAFDPTVMPLLRLWGFYDEDHRTVPSADAISRVLPLVDYRKIEIGDGRARIGRGQEMVTGSFMKSYAVDRMVEEMRRMGIDDAIVNAGGSSIRALNNAAHPSWEVNVRDTGNGSLLFTLQLSNAAYTTSAQNLTCVDIRGQRYGHIINPKTGRPSLNRHVGLITPACLDGDLLSTGLFLQSAAGFERRMAQLKEHLPVEGFFIGADGKLISTFGFGKHIKTEKT